MDANSPVRCLACGAPNRVPETKRHLPARCGHCHTPLTVEPPSPHRVTDASFERDVLSAPLPVLLDCWAPWCGPCRALGPVIDALARSYTGRVRVTKLNVDENPGVAARYGIQGIPTLLVFAGGHLVDRLVGVTPRGVIEARLDAVLAARAG